MKSYEVYTMAASKKLEWKFPQRNVLYMKLEIIVILILTVLVFVLTFVQVRGFLWAVLFAALFFGLYILIAYAIQIVRKVEESYQFNPQSFQIVHKTRFKERKESVALKDIKRHKLDRFLLGGYILTRKGKHLLFFNNAKELVNFEKFVDQHFKKTKKR